MTEMKPPPKDWPRLSITMFCQDAAAQIDWLCEAFDFDCRLKVEGDPGVIVHSELEYGGAVVMVSSAAKENNPRFGVPFKSPKNIGNANTQCLMIYVDDLEAHYARAKAAGADIRSEPEIQDYGDDYWSDKSYGAVDPEGHFWWFCQRLRSPQE